MIYMPYRHTFPRPRECMSVGLGDLCKCKCQHSQFTYSLLIKRNLHFFERASPKVGIEPTIVQLLYWRSSLLSYRDLNEIVGVSGTLYRIMRVDFHDFGIFDRKQYCQGPKSKLLENSRPTACYFQWNSWKLWSLIFRYWCIFMLV